MMLTEKEIFNQYEALKKTIALVKLRADGVRTLAEERKPRAIVFTGCGSSFSLSCSFRTIASMRLPLPVYAVAAGDLWLNAQRYQAMVRDALILSVSRSGKTSELVKAYEAVKALNVNASFLSVVCCEDTPVEALSDVTLCMPWAFDSSVCQTRCVSNLYAAGAMLVGALAGDGSIMAGMERVAVLGDAYLKLADALARRLAKTPWENVVVLADGEIDGLAEEAALAFKEISQLPSNYYHMLDVRHGTD